MKIHASSAILGGSLALLAVLEVIDQSGLDLAPQVKTEVRNWRAIGIIALAVSTVTTMKKG